MKLACLGLLAVMLAFAAMGCGGDSDSDSENEPTREPASNTAEPTGSTASETPSQAVPSATVTTPASPQPTPVPFAPFPERRADGVRQEDTCGPLTVVREYNVSGVRDSITVLAADGSTLLEIYPPDQLANVGVDWCYNIAGESQEELATFIYTGGAHCCIIQTVYSFDSGEAQEVFKFDAGNAGGLAPREIDGRPPVELLGLDDRLAYFDDLAFAASPFIPIAYAYRDGKWVEATRDFRGVVQQHRAQLRVEIDNTCTDQDTAVDCQRTFALAMLADSALLGDWETFRTTLSLQEGTWDWLLPRVSEVETLVGKPKDQVRRQ